MRATSSEITMFAAEMGGITHRDLAQRFYGSSPDTKHRVNTASTRLRDMVKKGYLVQHGNRGRSLVYHAAPDSLEAEVVRLRRRAARQPIETAPRDEQILLLTGTWRVGFFGHYGKWKILTETGWYSIEDGEIMGWCPLPEGRQCA